MTNVQVGEIHRIMGRKVRPTTKFDPQFVAVARDDPRDRTFKGNSSACCHGTFPSPKAYDATKTARQNKTNRGEFEFAFGFVFCALSGSNEISMEEKTTAQASSARIITGIE
jgi:hypothetical protein